MIKKTLFLLFLLLLVSCGANPISDILYHKNENKGKISFKNDRSFESYKISFEQELGISTINMPISFSAELESHHIGACYRYIGDTRGTNIEINKDQWDNLSDNQKEVLLYHELFHCTAGFWEHTDGYISLNGLNCPKSIMNTFLMSSYEADDCFSNNRSYYISELLSNI